MKSAHAKSIVAIVLFAVLSVVGGCGSKAKPPASTVDPNNACPTFVQAPAGLPTQAAVAFGADAISITASNYYICGTAPAECPSPSVVTGENSFTLVLHALDANSSPVPISAGVYPVIAVDPNDAATNPNMPNQKWAQGDFNGFSAPMQLVAQGNVTIDALTAPGTTAGFAGSLSGTIAVTLPNGNAFSLPLDSSNFCAVEPEPTP